MDLMFHLIMCYRAIMFTPIAYCIELRPNAELVRKYLHSIVSPNADSDE